MRQCFPKFIILRWTRNTGQPLCSPRFWARSPSPWSRVSAPAYADCKRTICNNSNKVFHMLIEDQRLFLGRAMDIPPGGCGSYSLLPGYGEHVWVHDTDPRDGNKGDRFWTATIVDYGSCSLNHVSTPSGCWKNRVYWNVPRSGDITIGPHFASDVGC